MLSDILNQPLTATIEEKEYSFEYDHASLAALEKRTGKSPYEIYDMLIAKNQVMLSDSFALLSCAMLKHHDKEDILDLEDKLRSHPGLWYEIKEAVVGAFAAPMLPPEIIRNLETKTKETPKKKARKKTSKI